MASWGVARAKAQFSEVLDKAEAEGPQLVTRRKQEFYVVTREQKEQWMRSSAEETKPFVSGWDALRPPEEFCFDYDFPRAEGKARSAKF